MGWVEIDKEKCNLCGLCSQVCERNCFELTEDRVVARADTTNCSLCGHCVAVCPEHAVGHKKVVETDTIQISRSDTPDSSMFSRFIRARRSHRNFKDRTVSREALDKLADVCRFCPTGSNAQSVNVRYLTNPTDIRTLSGLCVDYFREWVTQTEAESPTAVDGHSPEAAYLRQRLPLLKRHVQSWQAGHDPILRSAPVVMVFHSTPLTSTPKDNCVIAAHTVALYARTLGLESCYIGLLEKAFLGHEPVRTWLNLPDTHRVYSVLILGYPRFRFRRSVHRKPIPVQYT